MKEHLFMFPNNKLIVTNIINKIHTYIIELDDDYCPFIQGNHNEIKTMYMEINKIGMCLKCKKCPYEMLPNKGHISLHNDILESVFRTQICHINNISKNDINKIEFSNELVELYKYFKCDSIIETNNNNDYVEWNEVNTCFRRWWILHNSSKLPDLKTTKEYLNKIFKCKMKNHKIKINNTVININGWIGYKINYDDNDDNGDYYMNLLNEL